MHKTVYADGLGIQCLSECLGLIIVVFKESSQGSWGRFVFAPEFSAEDMAKARQGEAPVVWKLKQNIFSQCMLLNTPECHARDFSKPTTLILDLTGSGIERSQFQKRAHRELESARSFSIHT